MSRKMMIEEMLENSNSPGHPKLNDRQKEFIRGCTESQLLDHQFLTSKLSTLNVSDPETYRLQKMLKTAVTKEQTIELIRKLLIKAGTNVEQNGNDPFGDGDQSALLGADLEPQRQVLRELFASGGDIEHHMRPASGLTSFAWNCVMGDTKAVEQTLKTTLLLRSKGQQKQKSLNELMEYRETSMRLPPLILTMALSKHKQLVNTYTTRNVADMDHVGVFRTLIKYGASPNSKDVTGKTVCHYGAGSWATEETLEMTKMAIKATRTCALFGHKVILNGLSKKEYNGMKGTLGGYVAEKERRIIYPVAGSVVEHELSLKPENISIRITDDKKEKQICILDYCADTTTNLVDVTDRMGSISMHEVAMSQRDDVATFLCKHSSTCLDVTEGGGMSIRQVMVFPSIHLKNKVYEVLKRHAYKQAKKEEDMENLRKGSCENCNKRAEDVAPAELMQCSKCLVVDYCSKECQVSHWKDQHKHDCARLEKEGEVELGKPSTDREDMPWFREGEGMVVCNYAPPSGMKANEKFWIKVQSNGKDEEILIYDRSRTCNFLLPPGQPGHRELVEKVSSQKIYMGRKSFFKAKFNKKGKCIAYPHTSTARKW
jgi:hypothetical protein